MTAPNRKRKLDWGAWQTQRERFHLTEPLPPPPQPKDTKPADLVPAIMKKLNLESHVWEQALIDDWEKIVGPQVAAHTRPGRIQYGILHIYVENSMWLNELSRYSKDSLLNALQERFDAKRIRNVRLQLDPGGD
jgi:hypothetical protein